MPIYHPSMIPGSIPLPAAATTRDGFKFDPRPDLWRLSSLQTRSIIYDFAKVPVLSRALTHFLKLTVLDVLEKQSVSHAQNLWGRFLAFYRMTFSEGGTERAIIDIADLMNYRATLRPSTDWKLGSVRVLLKRAIALGYPVVTDEAFDYLCHAVIPQNPKGTHVRTLDPGRGAFTTLELQRLNAALNDGYVDDRVDLADYTLCHLMLAYGMRARQIAAMKESDLIAIQGADGTRIFTVRIPRAKQRGALAREYFTVRACDRRLGELVERMISSNSSFKSKNTDGQILDWPLFMVSRRGEVPGFAHHRTATELSARIQQIFERLVPLHANPKRFRHTLAKRAHDDGADIYVIAQLLDHSDTQSAGVYTEGSPDIVDRLNRSMVMELAPVAMAFAGVLISRPNIDTEQAGPARRIHDRALPGGNGSTPLGNCGRHGFCTLVRPIACYTCRNFRPWDDGPHLEVLDKLLEDREARRAKGYEPRIFGLHDLAITAVARVVQLCAASRATGVVRSVT